MRLLPFFVAFAAPYLLAAPAPPDGAWWRGTDADGAAIVVYPLQADGWGGDQLRARAAVAVKPKGSEPASWGVVWLRAQTLVDADAGRVALAGIEVVKGSFPSARDGGKVLVDAIRQSLPATGTLPLASLEASPAVEPTRRPAAPPRPKVVPPRIVFVSGPVLVVRIDGDPVIKPIDGTNFLRVANTRTLLFQDKYSSRFYLPVADGWLMGPGLNATWTVPVRRPPGLDEVRKSFAAGKDPGEVDEPGGAATFRLGGGKAPAVVVFTGPAELVRTAGKPELSPVPGTRLEYVRNTKSDVFFHAPSRHTFVLSSGRWFRARETRGPWEFVDETDLPRDFARIPRTHPKSAVLTHVPGAPEPAAVRKASRPGDVYAGPDGNTYRVRAGGGWEKTNGTDWYPVQTGSPYDKELVRRLEREETARQAGGAAPRP